MKTTAIALILISSISINSYSQVSSIDQLEQRYVNWFNKDLKQDRILGTSVDKAYLQVLKNKKPKKKVVVAVIDSGVDIYHEDLAGNIWINSDEIPDNQIDDDNNGFVDDIHGWNFIGNDSGENIYYDNLEYTRILQQASPETKKFKDAKTFYDLELSKREKEKNNIIRFEKSYDNARKLIKQQVGVEVSSLEDLEVVKSDHPLVSSAAKFLRERYAAGFTEEGLENLKKSNSEYLDYFLNIKFEPRALVGDNPLDLEDNHYGNSDVKGPRSDHGTSVAGVIAAVRHNGVGIDGIASNVEIMTLRTTPRGDERDKDVALGIIYAVDNGADIINMSFGKQISPQKEFVDQAVKYAEEKGVLIIHSSGNDGQDIDIEETYPSDRYLNGKEAGNWINVGASDMIVGTELVAIFSNYGEKHVDLFAPGVNIISTDSTNTYNMNDGTSLAGPIVSGIAALVLSYYPDLTAQQLIEVLMESSLKPSKPKKVFTPGMSVDKRSKVKFSKLSKSGGIVNAYNALLEAEKKSTELNSKSGEI